MELEIIILYVYLSWIFLRSTNWVNLRFTFVQVLCCRLNLEPSPDLFYSCNYAISESLRPRDSCLLMLACSLIVAIWVQSDPPVTNKEIHVRLVALSLTWRQMSRNGASFPCESHSSTHLQSESLLPACQPKNTSFCYQHKSYKPVRC